MAEDTWRAQTVVERQVLEVTRDLERLGDGPADELIRFGRFLMVKHREDREEGSGNAAAKKRLYLISGGHRPDQ